MVVLPLTVRNLYKYTKIYAGGEPELIEGDVFRTTVPIAFLESDKMSDKKPREILLARLRENGEVTVAEAAAILGRSVQTARRLLSGLVVEGLVVTSGANRNRKYRIK